MNPIATIVEIDRLLVEGAATAVIRKLVGRLRVQMEALESGALNQRLDTELGRVEKCLADSRTEVEKWRAKVARGGDREPSV